jgi:hypothetical protein
MPWDANGNFVPGVAGVNTTPIIPLTDEQRARVGDTAQELANAQQQGYIEANVLIRLLDLAKMLVPMFLP